jgi:hypothetical protein
MDPPQFLLLAAAVVFGLACRSYDNRYLLKLGWFAYLGASYLGGWFLTGSHAAGVAGVALWFMLPWLEIVGRVRRMRLPATSEVRHRFPPSRDVFPELGALSAEMEATGFTAAGDTGWKWSETEHFMRLFIDPEQRVQAAVSQAQQHELGLYFSYVSLTSRTPDGRAYTTTDYPFVPTMSFSPAHRVRRLPGAGSLDELLGAHRDFLASQGLGTADLADPDPEALADVIAEDLRAQIEHNLDTGVLEPAGEEGVIRYSWRGCVFLWLQVVKDMIRV